MNQEDHIESRDWRSFLYLLVLQTQNAFNDNFARFLLVPLVAWLGHHSLQHVLAASLVVPFLLFSPFAGWLADRLPKNRVIRCAAWMQLLVLALLLFGLSQKSLSLCCLSFFLLATQSALLSPSKMGIVKEQVGSGKLALASGVMEMCVILAILSGQIFSGFIFDSRLREGLNGWDAVQGPVTILALTGMLALVLAYGMRSTRSQSQEPLTSKVVFSHFRGMKLIFRELKLGQPALLVAYFWGFAGFINLVCIQAVTLIYGGEEGTASALSWMLVAASGGIAFGAGTAGWLSRKRIELGLVPIGVVLMTLGLLAMIFQDPASMGFKVFLTLTGMGGSMFMVPLTAQLLEDCPDAKRGEVMATSNILNNLAGIIAVGSQFTLQFLNVPLVWQIALVAVSGIAVTVLVMRRLAAAGLRFIGLGFLNCFYRIKVDGVEHVPDQGGALLLPNHVGYMDACLLSMACPRWVRFLISKDVSETWWAGPLSRLFDAVPISPKRAKEAISIAANAVTEGGVVAIYPEGQLTRTGMMNEVKSGYALIARKAAHPVIPVYVDGLWGSIFSYADGKFLKKWPERWIYDIRVKFGEPMQAKDATPQHVRETLLDLGRQCWEERSTQKWVKKIDRMNGHRLWSRWDELSEQAKSSIVLNALQLNEVYPAQKKRLLAVVLSGEETDILFGLALPTVGGVRVMCLDDMDQVNEKFDAIVAYEEGPVRSFVLTDGKRVEGYPALVIDGRVVSLAMPDPPCVGYQDEQAGQSEGSLGRLLPGVSVHADESSLHIVSPVGVERHISAYLNKDGFLIAE